MTPRSTAVRSASARERSPLDAGRSARLSPDATHRRRAGRSGDGSLFRRRRSCEEGGTVSQQVADGPPGRDEVDVADAEDDEEDGVRRVEDVEEDPVAAHYLHGLRLQTEVGTRPRGTRRAASSRARSRNVARRCRARTTGGWRRASLSPAGSAAHGAWRHTGGGSTGLAPRSRRPPPARRPGGPTPASAPARPPARRAGTRPAAPRYRRAVPRARLATRPSYPWRHPSPLRQPNWLCMGLRQQHRGCM